uniref:Outer envelope protein 61 n=1 Tax=Lactuca sativa TaxID=4236 RepID=A0A9R1XJN8_LACSA|nr:hypothetical protein LSAT_V11C300147690 [Lactuca sativa]
MFPGMMDPEMIRLAQEQMSRMSPAELSRIQQQMMSNPELMKMASESMKNMKPEDLRRAAEQLKSTQPDEMAEIGAKMANATPQEFASMRSQVDAQINYQLNAAQMLKQKAKNNLKSTPSSKGGPLLLACSLNLMSCYLKTNQYDECIKEGIEVLATDSRNVKALYRRGQAYKSLGKLENAVSDLTKALEFSPDDETIADVLRDAKEKLIEHGGKDATRGLKIEEITDEDPTPSSEMHETLSSNQKTKEINDNMNFPNNTEYLQSLKDDKESIRSFQNFMSESDPETLASMGGGKIEGISPDMVKSASNLISNMQPEEFQRMLEMATSFQGQNSPLNPNVTPDMLKTATDMMNMMPPEELQKMSKMALNGSNTESEGQERDFSTFNEDIGESSTSRGVSNSRNTPQPSFPSSSFDMQEQLKDQMKNPAMREMMSSMMKNISPDMMASMSEQFGYKMSREDAEKAQQAMSSLSPESIDKMMKWANRIQRGVEGAKSTKNWLLGRQGLAMALIMLLLAILLNWLGYIGH